MKKYVNNSLKLLASCMAAISAPCCFGLTSCSKSEAIEFANYESYMSEDLMEDLQSNYNIHFPNYTVAEMIPAKFEKFYDCAVPCGYELMTLLRNGWLEKIDWSKFNVKDSQDHSINTAEDAQQYLYIGSKEKYTGIADMNAQFTAYIEEIYSIDHNDKLIQVLKQDGTWKQPGDQFNILNYGVPYFAQSYMFAYTGSEIQFYRNVDGQAQKIEDPTWADIFYTISPSNPYREDRFKQKKIGMVDDARSFHDISRIVESCESDGAEHSTLDPVPNADINRVQQTMSHITGKFAGSESSFVLNSDSAIVSRGLADRKGDQTGVFSWSGDTIFAAQGAEEFESFTSKNFHIKKASDASFDEIEYVVINKKNEKNINKLNNIYSVVKQICLNGCDQTNEHICDKTGDKYKYWTMANWNTVMYTPLLKNVYSAVTDVTSSYWKPQITAGDYDAATIEDLFIPIINGKVPTGCRHLFGKTLTPLQNSNNHWAWLEQRGKL